MSNHCEALAGAPQMPAGGGGGRRYAPTRTPSNRPQGRPPWRNSRNGAPRPTPNTWKAVTRKFNDAASAVTALCYNMQDSMKDADIEYGFPPWPRVSASRA